MASQEEYEKRLDPIHEIHNQDWSANANADDRTEGLTMAHKESSTGLKNEHTLRTSGSTIREPQIEPISSYDRQELHRIASSIGHPESLARAATLQSLALEKTDTLAGIDLGNAVLDPNSPEFDSYKWARM